MNPNEIIEALEKLKCFKYLTQDDLPIFKTYLEKSIDDGWLDMPSEYFIESDRTVEVNEEMPVAVDGRTIDIDGSNLFRGGLESTLADFKYLFDIRNLKFEITPVEIEQEGDQIKHQIFINGRNYVIFDDHGERGSSEIIYIKSVFNLLNNELKIQNHKEEMFIAITSIETLKFMLVNKRINDFIHQLFTTNEFYGN